MTSHTYAPLLPHQGRGSRLHRLYVERLLVPPTRPDAPLEYQPTTEEEAREHERRHGAAQDHAPPQADAEDCGKVG